MISQKAEAKVNFRLLPGTRVEQLINDVETMIDDSSIEICAADLKTSPPVTDMRAPGYGQVKSAINARQKHDHISNSKAG